MTTKDSTRRDEVAKNKLEEYRMTYLGSIPADNFDRELWKSVKILSATVDVSGKIGKTSFIMTTPSRYGNYTGNMHGGAVATILDSLTNCTIAIIARKGYWEYSGVSRNLNISYLRPVGKEVQIVVDCEIVSSSNRLVTIQGSMKRAEDGKLLAICLQEMIAIVKPKL